MTNASNEKLPDIFSQSIDDLADLPGFETPPPGSYILEVTCEVKAVNEKDCLEASFKVVETQELENEDTDTRVADGTVFSTLFMLDNKFGIGNMKKFLKPFSEHFGKGNIGELVQELRDVKFACLVKNRKDKNDPDRVYGSVTNIVVV